MGCCPSKRASRSSKHKATTVAGEAQPSAAEGPRSSIVADRRRMFDKQDDAVEMAPLKRKAPGDANARHFSVTPAVLCCRCRKKVFPLDLVNVKDEPYHRECLKCAMCKRYLGDGQAFRKANDNLFCDSRERDCFSRQLGKDRSRILSATAGERVVIADDEQVDVKGVIEENREELEAAVEGLVPRCLTCGGAFKAGQETITIQMQMWHAVCKLNGKAMFEQEMNPRQARRALPELVAVKFKCGERSLTFFFVPDESQDDSDHTFARVVYVPDPKAYESSKRRLTVKAGIQRLAKKQSDEPGEQPGEEKDERGGGDEPKARKMPEHVVVTASGQATGGEFGSADAVVHEDGSVEAVLTHNNYGLAHRMVAQFGYDLESDMITAKCLEVTITKH